MRRHKFRALRTFLCAYLMVASVSAAVAQEAAEEGEVRVDTNDIIRSLQSCDGNQIDMNACAAAHARAVEPLLDATTAKVRASLERDSDRIAFDGAQSAFTDSVAAACALDAALISPGSMAGWSQDYCIVRRVALRIQVLNTYMDCVSGRTSCENGITLTDVELGPLP